MASSMTMIALFPPSSSIEWPKRPATEVATLRPCNVDPVNETRGTRLSSTRRWPTSAPLPMTRFKIPSTPNAAITRLQMCWTAMPHSGACEEGFQITVSPHTAAIAAFQDHTATGKLKAEITPTDPRGCHCSYMRWRGRSECIERP